MPHRRRKARAKAKTRTGLVYSASERGSEVFSCPIECMQCLGKRADGRQCSRRSCIGTPFCWTHARQLVGVQVKDYPGMGKGVEAVGKGSARERRQEQAGATGGVRKPVVFKAGDFIMPYTGEVLSKEEYDRRYVTGRDDSMAEYVIVDGAKRFVDAACQRRLSGIVNTVTNKKPAVAPEIAPVGGAPVQFLSSVLTGTNCKFTIRTKAHDWHGLQVPAKSAWVVATKPIREGDQLLCYYGRDYRVYITPGFQSTSTTRRKIEAGR